MDFYEGRNRANNVGGALEQYVKDLFSGTFDFENTIERNKVYSQVFSYQGNQNNPPDLMLKMGDAIEVKKIQSPGSDLALNSSYPKAKVYSDSAMITQACRECEDWSEKDIIYVVGYTDDNKIKWLWFVYGDCYAADSEIYERVKQKISTGLDEIPNVELVPTNELGKINSVDPLGITKLRIRGMWHISNPNRVFSYLSENDQVLPNLKFKATVLMTKEKFESFSAQDQLLITSNTKLKVEQVEIQNPSNPSILLEAKRIVFHYE